MTEPSPAGDATASRAMALRLGAATCGLLILELATIRWVGSQVRLFGFFQNIILIAAFLGMGLGVGLGRRWPQLVHLALPALLVLLVVLSSADFLGLTTLSFPDPSLFLWGLDAERGGATRFLAATLAVTVVFWLVVAVFAAGAAPVGDLFGRLPPLRAYGWDLGGSLAGVGIMSGLSFLTLPPAVWFAAGVSPLLWLSPRATSWAAAAAAVAVVAVGTGSATFSPYNRLDLVPDPVGDGLRAGDFTLRANHDYHQAMLNLGQDVLDRAPAGSLRHGLRAVYEMSFKLARRRDRALVVGAGTGNDVMAALRLGFREVVCVEIDPRILEFGRRLHPEQPYSDPRAVAVNTDARAYFEQHGDERFDVVAYGLLDSHSVFSAMSSLRLDNYVYTVEGVRSAWRLVKEDGLLALSFSVAGNPWMQERLRGIVREATGIEPVAVAHGLHGGTTWFAARGLRPDDVPPSMGRVTYQPEVPVTVPLPTDDWPFLYLSPGKVPWAYLSVLSVLLATATLSVRAVFRPARGGSAFDRRMFLLGVGFMLLEARMVTALSLLFGSTWIVNTCVFGGILSVVLLANVGVALRPPRNLKLWVLPLFLSLALVAWLDAGRLNHFSMLTRGVLGGLVCALPVGFAGVVFSGLLRRSKDPAASLGSNLLGAVLGGMLEYLSMAIGLRGLVFLAAAAYAGATLLPDRDAEALPDSP